MSVPGPYAAQPEAAAEASPGSPGLIRSAIWVAIGALIAAAIVCVVWVFIGDDNGIIGRAFGTIALLVGFAGATILDAHLAPRRPAWFALSSMIGWIALLLIGATMLWMPERSPFSGFGRFIQFLVIVLIVQLALLHIRLFMKASKRLVNGFTQVVTIITVALVVGLAALLIVPLMLWEYATFTSIYWRIIVATAILAAVGTALVPLVNVLFAPKRPQVRAPYPYPPVPQAYTPVAPPAYVPAATPAPFTAPGTLPPLPPLPTAPVAAPAEPAAPPAPEPVAEAPARAREPELLPWPTYVDGVTPLPIMPDGQPDWGAYYTGHPSPGAYVVPPAS